MATNSAVKTYIETYKKFQLLLDDKDRIIRPSFGEEGYVFLEPIIDHLKEVAAYSRRTDFTAIPTQVLANLSSGLQEFITCSESVVALTPGVFADPDEKKRYQAKFQEICDSIQTLLPHFTSIELQQSGLLADNWPTKLQAILDEEVNKFTNHIDHKIQEVKDTHEKVQELAKQIQDLHAETATDAALKTVKEQFRNAAEETRKSRNRWGWIGGGFILIFFVLLVLFATLWQPGYNNDSEGFHWSAVYSTLIRLTILTSVAAVVSFCAKMYRAHSHLHEHAKHRLRTANSYTTFIDSAQTEDQRDVILSKLVDTITHFGSSGLLQTDDDAIHPSKMTIETINKSLSAIPKSS